MKVYDGVEAQALHLPREERSKLASRLLESLDDDADLSPEWRAEIDRRIEDLGAGRVELVPHQQALLRVRERLSEARDGKA